MTTTLGQGTTLSYYNSTYVKIGTVLDISGPNRSRDVIETTILDQSSNHKSYVGGLVDSGEISFTIQYTPGTTADDYILGKLDDSTADSAESLETLKLVFTDSGTTDYYFNGIFTGFSPNIVKDDVVTATITFKVSGAATEVDPNA